MQRIPLGRQSLKRPNMLAVVPRFEHRWFSASLPVVVDDWRFLRIGFAMPGWLFSPLVPIIWGASWDNHI
ncbi:MAG: hypothetical protein IPL65_16755 [Lewinellaceae bacterium]|nr:hypothetical protein [Lewinellaceae bacterium]